MSDDSFVTADGVRLHVDAAGEGPVVVFQHGLCGDCGQTGEAFPPDAGFRRLTIEARGHGLSEAGDPARFSIARFAADVAEVIEQRIGKPVIVGGISMGAAMALHLAVHRSDLVRGLVLARPAWVTAAGPENMAPNAEVGRLLQRLAPEAAKAEFLAGATGRRLAAKAPDNLASLTGFFSRQPVAVTAALLTAISADGPGVTETDLAAIGVPTLVIGHGRDVIHPLGHTETLAARIPGARLVEITPKAVSRAQYIADFHYALTAFLREF